MGPRILVIGCGSVAQCVVPILLRDRVVSPDRITILDMVDNRERVAAALTDGVTYEIGQVTPDNLDQLLSTHLTNGDICLDLAWNIDTMTMLEWCRAHGVRYLNTSVEVWDPYDDAEHVHPLDRTLYVRHMAMRRMIRAWGDNRGPSAVVEHGANPGLVSHFVKASLLDLAERGLSEGRFGDRADAVAAAAGDERFNDLAHVTGVKVVHVAERDTQVASIPRRINEFVNTWSIDGLYEEGVAPAELGWGTHERRMPPNSYQHAGEGPGNQICIAQPGALTRVRSWVPAGEIIGMVIRHGEAFTITDHLTVWDGERAVYRPTVHYAYCPASDAIASLQELEMRHWDLQDDRRILNDEIVPGGRDELGVLLMGHPYRAWWTGSLLSIDEARELVPHQNATTVQVACSVVAAVRWMEAHPNDGVRVPDELPWREVLEHARPYLGPWHSEPVDWDPVSTRVDVFSRFSGRSLDSDDPWQFTNFLV